MLGKLIACVALESIMCFATSAYGIGTTNCMSGDGQVKRTEQEVWGANIVTWEFHGQTLPDEKVKLQPGEQVVLTDAITQDPNMGETRTLTTVEQAVFKLSDGSEPAEFVICKTVEYPNVLD